MANRLLFSIIFLAAIFSSVPAAADDSAVVLMYHRFGEDRYPATNIKVEQFRAQLELLKNEGFTVVPLADLHAALTEGKSLPPQAVVITIDDAYRSIYNVAYPLFRQYGFPFTVFIATDPVDDGLRGYLSWEQIREMADNGATFANHGASHCSYIRRLEKESDDARVRRVMADAEKGQKRIAGEVSLLPGVFAYPYGEYDTRIARLLREKGYISFGQQSGAIGQSSDLRALPRYPVAEAYADIDELRVKLNSLPMPVLSVSPWDPVVSNRRPELEISIGEIDGRLNEIACYISGQGRGEIRWIEKGKRFAVRPQKDLGSGRQRVNFTIPGNDGRYYWFSHPWFVNVQGP